MKTPRALRPGVSWSKLRNAAGILRIKPPPSPHHSPYIAARLVLPVPYGGMKGGTTTDLRSPGDRHETTILSGTDAVTVCGR
jgi:hypothetical protein